MYFVIVFVLWFLIVWFDLRTSRKLWTVNKRVVVKKEQIPAHEETEPPDSAELQQPEAGV